MDTSEGHKVVIHGIDDREGHKVVIQGMMILKVTKWSSRELMILVGLLRLLGDRNTNGAGDLTSPKGPGLAPSPGLSRASGVTSKMGTTSGNQMKINLLFQIHIH